MKTNQRKILVVGLGGIGEVWVNNQSEDLKGSFGNLTKKRSV